MPNMAAASSRHHQKGCSESIRRPSRKSVLQRLVNLYPGSGLTANPGGPRRRQTHKIWWEDYPTWERPFVLRRALSAQGLIPMTRIDLPCGSRGARGVGKTSRCFGGGRQGPIDGDGGVSR